MQSDQKKILIVDEDASVRLLLSQTFTRIGWQVRATGSVATLLRWVAEGGRDLAACDLVLADTGILEALPRLRKEHPRLPVVLISAQCDVLTAVNAVQAGVFEHLTKPVNADDVVAAATRAVRTPADKEAARSQARGARADRLPLIGGSAAMQQVYRILARLVSNDLPVLICGESGAGKQLVARVLHEMGPRRDRVFATVNLAATPADRLEPTLFGDAHSDGKLIEADGGTLFLKGVDMLLPEAQMRLLPLIDAAEAMIKPGTDRRANVRLVVGATRDLRSLVRDGAFREDLFFRLNVAPLRLPPLRERLEDIADLTDAFLLRAAREGLAVKTLDPGAIERLKAHRWPGNVRELANLIRRICALYGDDVITARLVERELAGPAPGDEGQQAESLSDLIERKLHGYFEDPGEPPARLYHHLLEQLERPLFRMTMAETRGNQLRAATLLGVNRNTLRRKLEELQIDGVSRRRRRVALVAEAPERAGLQPPERAAAGRAAWP